jgi:carboxyl-terminal processing protease
LALDVGAFNRSMVLDLAARCRAAGRTPLTPDGAMTDFSLNRRPPLFVFFLMVVAFATGSLTERFGWLPGGGRGEPPGVARTFAPFWEAWRLVHRNYVDRQAVNDEHLMQGAIVGMLASLGDIGHTTYLTREDVRRLEEGLQGQFEGIGARLTVRKGRPTILQTMPKSPARAAGLRPGDVIEKVDGEDVSHLSLEQLVQRVRGKAGTPVTLTVRREGASQPLDIKITRGKVDVPDVSWHMLPGSPVAHVAIQNFGDHADRDLRAAVQEARERGARGLILDVRGNPGGLKEQAVKVTGDFLKPDQWVFIEQDAQGRQTKQFAKEAGLDTTTPVCALVDGGTASSAEIFAGALQDWDRGPVVGTRTFGTGTVLKPFQLSDGSALLLAVELWLTPKGHTIWHKGIEPNVEVELPQGASILLPDAEEGLTPEKFAQSEDKQLLKALEVIKAKLPAGE